MKFKVTKASDWEYEKIVEIKSLKELVDFIEENGEIIIGKEKITIYDDYVE